MLRRTLNARSWVGVGSVCKRNGNPDQIEDILLAIKALRPDLRLHGFGINFHALQSPTVRELLHSSDSIVSHSIGLEFRRSEKRHVASLQRLLAEPSWRQNSFEQAAALTTYNQRLTRTVTVLGQHLNKCERITQPGFVGVVSEIGETIESFETSVG
jgi:hypothetical protein